MNILIVTASVGSGHEKAAAAVEQGLRDRFPDAEISIVDFMSSEVSSIHYFTKQCYLAMLNMVPYLYECMYNFTASPRKGGAIQAMTAAAMANAMKKLIRKYDPQMIFCTHPFPTEAVSHLSDKWRSRFKSAALITDYSVHQMWVCRNIDMYFVAHSAMVRALAAYGISRAMDCGIPVDKKFYVNFHKEKLRRQLGLESDLPTILMMGGGLGLGGMDQALDQLEQVTITMQVLVVGGRNHELVKKVQNRAEESRHRLVAFGYVDNVHELMAAADLLVSKPGGITLTEAMTSGIPMLLHQPIPGPESDNARYMSDHGIARWLRTDEQLSDVIQELLSAPEILKKMNQASRRHVRQNAAGKIAETMSTLLD